MCPLTSEIPKSISLFDDSQASPICLFDKSYVKLKMSMDHWWNGTDGRKLKYLEINLYQWPFVHHIDWPEATPLEASNYTPQKWHGPSKHC